MSSSSEHTVSQSPDMMSDSPSPPPRSSGGDGRQLPTIPDNSTPYTLHQTSKGNNQAISNRGSNGFGPFFQEYSMMAEYSFIYVVDFPKVFVKRDVVPLNGTCLETFKKAGRKFIATMQLQQQKIPGVYVMPCANTSLVWSGLIFVRQGLYQGAALRFSLTIPDNYPDGSCPSFVFEFPVFHPLVHPETGCLDVQRAFPRWRRNVHHLWQVILYAKKVFYKVDTKSPANLEAASLYETDMAKFKTRVARSLEQSKERLYQAPALDDPFALRFSPWNEAVHPDAKRQMLQASQRLSSSEGGGGSADPADLGLSWMGAPVKVRSRSNEEEGET